MANTIESIPNQKVVSYANPSGVTGADAVSVNTETGEVSLWDNKFRSSEVGVKPSSTFKVSVKPAPS